MVFLANLNRNPFFPMPATNSTGEKPDPDAVYTGKHVREAAKSRDLKKED